VDKGIQLKDSVFAMKHDSVITMMYQKQVDAGATFYSPPENGKIEDARRLVLQQYPDVEEKIKNQKALEELFNKK
jgi:phosphonate transport system substrate-binding protein